jgi:hypothetical protein
MSAKSYTIRHNGHTISREGDFFHVSTANDDVATVPLRDGKYCSGDGVNISDDNAWINNTLVVRDGGALCYSIHYAGYTITRSAGSLNIVIKGNGIQNPITWQDPTQTSDLVRMHDGSIFVDDEQLVHNDMLFAYGVDMTEAEVRSMEQASQPIVAPISCSTAQSHPGLRPVNGPSTGSLPNTQSPVYKVTRGCYTLSRYEDCFVYNVPEDRGNSVELKAMSYGADFGFHEGNVWLGPIHVIEDWKKLILADTTEVEQVEAQTGGPPDTMTDGQRLLEWNDWQKEKSRAVLRSTEGVDGKAAQLATLLAFIKTLELGGQDRNVKDLRYTHKENLKMFGEHQFDLAASLPLRKSSSKTKKRISKAKKGRIYHVYVYMVMFTMAVQVYVVYAVDGHGITDLANTDVKEALKDSKLIESWRTHRNVDLNVIP